MSWRSWKHGHSYQPAIASMPMDRVVALRQAGAHSWWTCSEGIDEHEAWGQYRLPWQSLWQIVRYTCVSAARLYSNSQCGRGSQCRAHCRSRSATVLHICDSVRISCCEPPASAPGSPRYEVSRSLYALHAGMLVGVRSHDVGGRELCQFCLTNTMKQQSTERVPMAHARNASGAGVR